MAMRLGKTLILILLPLQRLKMTFCHDTLFVIQPDIDQAHITIPCSCVLRPTQSPCVCAHALRPLEPL